MKKHAMNGRQNMTEERFEIGESENQDTIFDNEGPDDYYHLGNDTRDVKALCKLLNELSEENQQLKKENHQLKHLIQAIISKEFEISSEDNDYDALTKFFKNEVSISQIEVDIDVEKEEREY